MNHGRWKLHLAAESLSQLTERPIDATAQDLFRSRLSCRRVCFGKVRANVSNKIIRNQDENSESFTKNKTKYYFLFIYTLSLVWRLRTKQSNPISFSSHLFLPKIQMICWEQTSDMRIKIMILEVSAQRFIFDKIRIFYLTHSFSPVEMRLWPPEKLLNFSLCLNCLPEFMKRKWKWWI